MCMKANGVKHIHMCPLSNGETEWFIQTLNNLSPWWRERCVDILDYHSSTCWWNMFSTPNFRYWNLPYSADLCKQLRGVTMLSQELIIWHWIKAYMIDISTCTREGVISQRVWPCKYGRQHFSCSRQCLWPPLASTSGRLVAVCTILCSTNRNSHLTKEYAGTRPVQNMKMAKEAPPKNGMCEGWETNMQQICFWSFFKSYSGTSLLQPSELRTPPFYRWLTRVPNGRP